MVNCLNIKQIDEDDLTEEELENLLDPNSNGILSHKVIPYNELDDETLEDMFQYNKDNIEWLIKIRPDFIQRCHPEILN